MPVRDPAEGPAVPTATYRLQFHREFPLHRAEALVGYLAALGVTDCYASPLLKARPGSLHGYDTVDPGQVNPEVGGEAELHAFSQALRHRDMGLVLDIVPNHMCISHPDNAWWQDVLMHGPASPWAGHFDVDWGALEGKVLLPVLGGPFGTVLEGGELRVEQRPDGFAVRYYEHAFPVAPRTWPLLLQGARERLEAGTARAALDALLDEVTRSHAPSPGEPRTRETLLEASARARTTLAALKATHPAVERALAAEVEVLNGTPGAPRSFDRLQTLLDVQHYRLSHWRLASEVINYRRFFSINDLAGLREEDPQVFHDVHALVLRLVGDGVVTGLRVDHPDGLYDPEAYFRDLQHACGRALHGRLAAAVRAAPAGTAASVRPMYVVAEKILIGNEALPTHWAVHGTTGYEFLNRLNGLYVSRDHEADFRRLYADVTARRLPFPQQVRRSKRFVLHTAFRGEAARLTAQLAGIAARHRLYRDLPGSALRTALEEVAVDFPVYRTYVSPRGVAPVDGETIGRAVTNARTRHPRLAPEAFDLLEAVLRVESPDEPLEPEERAEWVKFAQRFQQFTAPLMAKGLEDTALYRHHPLASLNEVGGEPDAFGVDLADFHAWCTERQAHWPHALSATATHDTKRGEDVRARLNVLSEMPEPWAEAFRRWQALNAAHKPVVHGMAVPDTNEEYLLYQTLVGTWPEGGPTGSAWRGDPGPGYPERIGAYMVKAVREAKQNSSWLGPDPEHEAGVRTFVEAVLTPGPDNTFLRDLEAFLPPVARAGYHNSLSQTLVKIAAPGVPDFYQGTELWDFSLVDPDNRRPVDFAARTEALADLQRQAEVDPAALARALLLAPEDGRVKLLLIQRALHYRNAQAALFREGCYVPLAVEGPLARHVIAFARQCQERMAVAVAGRFFLGLGAPPAPVGPAVWGDTAVVLPEAPAGGTLHDVVTGHAASVQVHDGRARLPVGEALRYLPATLLEAR